MGFRKVDAWTFRIAGEASNAAGTLVLFGHAGAAAHVYSGWEDLIPRGWQALAVQLPGRGTRLGEACLTDLGGILDQLAAQSGAWTPGPLALYGHSMGGLLAFELARRLSQSAARPCAVVVSGLGAPHRAKEQDFHRLDDGQFLFEMQRYGALDPETAADPGWRETCLPALRADILALERHRFNPVPAWSGPLVVIDARDDAAVAPEERAGWPDLATGSLRSFEIPGGHFAVFEQRETMRSIFSRTLNSLAGA